MSERPHINNNPDMASPVEHSFEADNYEAKLNELKEIYSKRINSESGESYYEQMNEFVNELREEYGDDTLIKTRLYHVLTFSGLNTALPIVYFDVPGGKIESFIRGEDTE